MVRFGAAKGAGVSQDDVAKRTDTSWQKLKYSRPMNYEVGTFVQNLLATWASPFLDRGSKEGFKQEDAEPLLSSSDRVEPLMETFRSRYPSETEDSEACSRICNPFLFALLSCNASLMLKQAVLTIVVSMSRVFTAFAFCKYVGQLHSETEEAHKWGSWYAWMWAGLILSFQIGQVLCQHRLDWCGARLGHRWTQQAKAGTQEKLARLKILSCDSKSMSTIIKLVSDHTRTFEEIAQIWTFLWAAPLEAILCTVLVALTVGWVPAVDGMAAMLMVIPIQAKLMTRMQELKQRVAAQSEKRDGLAGEVVEGASKFKMLGWESYFEQDHAQNWQDEAKPLMTLQLITASIGTVSVFCVPVACVVTFGTAVAMGKVCNRKVPRRCWV